MVTELLGPSHSGSIISLVDVDVSGAGVHVCVGVMCSPFKCMLSAVVFVLQLIQLHWAPVRSSKCYQNAEVSWDE